APGRRVNKPSRRSRADDRVPRTRLDTAVLASRARSGIRCARAALGYVWVQLRTTRRSPSSARPAVRAFVVRAL
ncbi:hypothetical protein, partial [Streptomyces clavuligerus]